MLGLVMKDISVKLATIRGLKEKIETSVEPRLRIPDGALPTSWVTESWEYRIKKSFLRPLLNSENFIYLTPQADSPHRAFSHITHGVHIWFASVIASVVSCSTFHCAPSPSFSTSNWTLKNKLNRIQTSGDVNVGRTAEITPLPPQEQPPKPRLPAPPCKATTKTTAKA